MMAATPGTAPTDEALAALVARCADDDRAMSAARAAFEQLYRRHSPALLAFIAARVRRGDLDDLHQEIWKRVWLHPPAEFRDSSFRAWLFQVARNAIIDLSRKRKPELHADQEHLTDARSAPIERSLIEAEHAEALRRCLERLEPRAAALVRARLAGEDYPAVCARLKLTANAAYKMMNEAKSQLRTCVERALS
jgi:RNA polymerase sigma-70 factor (ECF subfamily)